MRLRLHAAIKIAYVSANERRSYNALLRLSADHGFHQGDGRSYRRWSRSVRKARCENAQEQLDGKAAYLSELATKLNVVDKLVPRSVSAPIITTAMSAAMSPYSIAVAPDSFLAKRE